jgi:hypothetical protein
MRRLLPCLLAALGLLSPALSGCSSGEDAADRVTACFYDFAAEVSEGPDTGLQIRGRLLMFQQADGGISASFIPGGTSDLLHVPATVDGGNVSLEFSVPAGTVRTSGQLQKSPEDCSATLTGKLSGPAGEDTGEWSGEPACAKDDAAGCSGNQLVSGSAEATCTAACGDAGHSEAACQDFCGVR